MESGQCFRVRRFPDGTFRFITGGEVLYLRRAGEESFEASCTPEAWDALWAPYFSLDVDYRTLRRAAAGKNAVIDAAMREGEGLRLLRQDPWEMLITFILSQRKSIPAIASAVEGLARRYGARLETPRETLYAFPTAEQLRPVTEQELREAALGYRAPYVADAVRRVLAGDPDLEALRGETDEALGEALRTVYGVGKKVAACVALFGYGRTGCVPVDVWIRRAIEEDCGGCEPFSAYGEAAGLMQQYVFYFMQKHKNDKKTK